MNKMMFCVVVFSMRSMGHVERLEPCRSMEVAKQVQTNAILENIHGFLDNTALTPEKTQDVKRRVAEIIDFANKKEHDKALHAWRVMCLEYEYDIAIQIETIDSVVTDEVEPADAKLEHYFLVLDSDKELLNPGINRAVRQEHLM